MARGGTRPPAPNFFRDGGHRIPAMPVNREQIVTVALDLLDEQGLAGLTLRELAARLGIRAPTLYWHVRDKRELLDLLAAAIMDEALAAWREPQPGQPWGEWLPGPGPGLRGA